jgi:hypothetical protein
MRYLWLLSLLLLAFKPIQEVYDKPEKIKDEFDNLEQDAQSEQFDVWKTTPNLTDLKDGQIVIFSSGAIKLMWRNRNDIYAVQGSCITIRR